MSCSSGKPFVWNVLSRNRYRSIAKANRKRVLRMGAGTATDIKLDAQHTCIHRMP